MKAKRLLLVGMALPVLLWAGWAPSPSAREPVRDSVKYRWFSLPVQVEGLPSKGEFIPVSCAVDFSALLKGLRVSGAVDSRSLRLYREGPDRQDVEEVYQFTSAPQPRPKERHLLPDTPPSVSYLGEHPAGETPELPRVAGDLAWVARGDAKGSVRYRLLFGVPLEGVQVQVPFPPQDLHAFDREGRARPPRWFPHMQIRPQWPLDGVVHVYAGRELVTSYHLGPTAEQGDNFPVRRPFLYPVNGPDGLLLTDLGKPHDPTGSHAHHDSLWVGHASVNGQDFWGEKGGRIVHRQIESMEDGPVFCRLVQRTGWVAGGSELVRERRTLTVYRTPETFRLLDVELELEPRGGQAVTFGKTSFGFLAVRVRQSMTVFDGGGEIRNARGDRNERGAHLKRAEWIDQSGPVSADAWGGIAVLDCPENPNHPTGWHCRNDGWAGAAFNMEQPWTVRPGQKLRLRYRIHLHRQDAAGGEVARRWDEYRSRPSVQVGKPAPAK